MNKIKLQILITLFPLLGSCQNSSSQDIEFKRLTENIVIIKGDTLTKNENSLYQKLYENGKVELEGKLVNDKKNGRWMVYYEDGKICKEIDYVNGVQNGKFIWYFTNGNKQQEADVVEGIKHGEDKYWNADGTLNSITIYEKGEQMEIRAYKPNYINTTDTTTYKGDVIWTK